MTAWEQAHKLGRRAFYERSTDTLRSCPENYCLAHRVGGRWRAYRDEGATRALHDAFDLALQAYRDGSTGDALADLLGALLPPPTVPR